MRATLRAAGWVALNELRRIVRHPEIVIFGLVLPVIIITLVGLTFGTGGAIEVGVVDRDGTARSAELVARLEAGDGVQLRTYDDVRSMRKDVRLTGIQAGLVIPEGYGRDLDAGTAQVDVVVEPSDPGVASALAAFDAAVTSVGVEQGAVQFVAERLGGGARASARAEDLVQGSGEQLEPVLVEDLDPDAGGPSGTFDYTAPANLVLFVFINTFAVSTAIAFDRREGKISRMLSTPNPPGGVLLGIGLSRLAFALVQSTLIVGVGALAFGVGWGSPVTVAVLVVLWALVATSVGVLLGSLLDDPEQAQAVGIPIAVGCGMLGGCMWPLGIVPDVVRQVGHLTPHAWVMDAWQEVMFDRAGLAEILPNVLVLSAMVLVVGALATRALRRSVLG